MAFNLSRLTFAYSRCLKRPQTFSFFNPRPLMRFHTKPTENVGEEVKFSFVYLKDGERVDVTAREGQHLLEIAHKHEIALEGACEASLACSTCHIILPNQIYDDLEEATEEEEDLLDLAWGLTHTSRLGCQVFVTKEFEGIEVQIPSCSRNFYVDGHVPKPH